MVGSKGSTMGFIMGRDLQNAFYPKAVSGCRCFRQAIFRMSTFTHKATANFPNERAGSNDSDKDDYVNSDGGWDNFFRLRFKYLLPIGHGKDEIISTQVVDRGLLVKGAVGGESWNPLSAGGPISR
jgi:hypothetical protein